MRRHRCRWSRLSRLFSCWEQISLAPDDRAAKAATEHVAFKPGAKRRFTICPLYESLTCASVISISPDGQKLQAYEGCRCRFSSQRRRAISVSTHTLKSCLTRLRYNLPRGQVSPLFPIEQLGPKHGQGRIKSNLIDWPSRARNFDFAWANLNVMRLQGTNDKLTCSGPLVVSAPRF